MPLIWSGYAVARAAGLLGVTAFAGSALTQAVVSRLLVDDASIADIATIRRSNGADDPDAEAVDPKQAARERQLSAALKGQQQLDDARQLDTIVEHNLFCPTCRPVASTPTSDTANGELEPSPTTLPLALIATMEAEQPGASLATIRDTERRSTGVYGLGEPVRPGVIVAGVEQGRVVLRSQGELATLEFTAEPEAKPKAQAKAKPKPKKNSREIPGAREAIDCTGNGCTIDREFVEKLLENPRELTRQAKLVPAVENGQTRGFRIHRVRRGTLPQLLGLKNGDTLLSVNGIDLDSMDQAISLYSKLRRASELDLTVERKGKLFEKQISIR